MGTRNTTDQSREWWCRLVHSKITWPRNGRYRCLQCKREYSIPWSHHDHAAEVRTQAVLEQGRPFTAMQRLRAITAVFWWQPLYGTSSKRPSESR